NECAGEAGRLVHKVGAILQSAGRPMHFTEVAKVYARRYPGIAGDLRDRSDDRGAPKGGSFASRAHTVAAALDRNKDVYLIGSGTYIHAEGLTVARDRLNEIVEWCLRRIEGEPGAISTEFLLTEIET